MSNVFNTENIQVAGVYDGTRALLIANGPGTNSRPLLLGTQQLQVSFAQDQRRFFTLDGPYIYLYKGRPQGQCGIAGLIAAPAAIKAFMSKYGDLCQTGKNIITLQSNQNDCAGTGDKSGGLNVRMYYCTANNIGLSMNAQDAVLNSQIAVTFTDMDLV